MGILSSKKIVAVKQDKNRVIKHFRSDLKEKRAPQKNGLREFFNFVRAFDFPPFDLPFIEINNEKYYLTLDPKKHGYNGKFNCLTYKKYKIFLIPEVKE